MQNGIKVGNDIVSLPENYSGAGTYSNIIELDWPGSSGDDPIPWAALNFTDPDGHSYQLQTVNQGYSLLKAQAVRDGFVDLSMDSWDGMSRQYKYAAVFCHYTDGYANQVRIGYACSYDADVLAEKMADQEIMTGNVITGTSYAFTCYIAGVYNKNDLVVEDWDDPISENPEDPLGFEPIGGENADTMPLGETFEQLLADIPTPNLTMTMDYGAMLTTYCMDTTAVSDVGSALFTAGFWTNLKNKFEGLSDPLSMIVNAFQVPFSVSGGQVSFKLGGIMVEDGEGHNISVTKITTRYIQHSMGSITLKEVFGTEKDYSCVGIDIFLPYVGMKSLDPDIVVGNTLTLVANIDVWTGDVTYLLHVSNATAARKYFQAQSVPYRWTGNCGKKIPLGRVDNTNQILNMIGTIGGIAAGALTMGAGAGAVMGSMGAGIAGSSALSQGLGTMKIGAGLAGASAAHALHANFNPMVQSSGAVQGALGQMDYQYAYIVVKRGVPTYPANWREEIGAPRYQEFTVDDLSGYTEFAEIHADDIPGASDEEKQLIEDILKSGVII